MGVGYGSDMIVGWLGNLGYRAEVLGHGALACVEGLDQVLASGYTGIKP